MIKKHYRPYFKAIKKVLSGTPVENLDDIREECNTKYLRDVSRGISEKIRGYTADSMLLSFIADAENKILMGSDPDEVYASFKKMPVAELRSRGRKVLDVAIRQYLGE